MKRKISDLILHGQLSDLTSELIELILDSELPEGVLRDFPMGNTLLALIRMIKSQSDKLLVKRALCVLLEIGVVDSTLRKAFIHDLKSKYGSGSENLLIIIDKLDNYEKSIVFGRLCRIRAEQKITKDQFMRIKDIIISNYLKDFELITHFKNGRIERFVTDDEKDYYPIIKMGALMETRGRIPGDWKEKENSYKSKRPKFIKDDHSNFKLYELSPTGEILNQFYNELFSNL